MHCSFLACLKPSKPCDSITRQCVPLAASKDRLTHHCGTLLDYEFRFAFLLCDGVRDISVIISGREAVSDPFPI